MAWCARTGRRCWRISLSSSPPRSACSSRRAISSAAAFTHQGEYYALLLLSTLGMMLMSAAANLMIVFVGLEVLSLSLYILCAILPTRPALAGSGLKYFILSSFASAFLLYGMALTYGASARRTSPQFAPS